MIRRRMFSRMSFATKSTLVLTIPVFALGVLFSMIFHKSVSSHEMDDVSRHGALIAHDLATYSLKLPMGENGSSQALDEFAEGLFREESVVALAVFGEDEEIVYFRARPGAGLRDWSEALNQAQSGETAIVACPEDETISGDSNAAHHAPSNQYAGGRGSFSHAAIAMSLRKTHDFLGSIERQFVIAILLSVALTFLAMRLFVHQQLKPLSRLVEGAESIAAGNFTQRFESDRNDEIGRLTGAFNKMVQDLDVGMSELRQTRERLNNVLESSTEYGIIATDLQGNIQLFNEGARRLLGSSPDSGCFRTLGDCLVLEKDVLPRMDSICDELDIRDCWDWEIGLKRADGSVFPASVTLTPFRDATGSMVGVIAVFKDETRRSVLERRLKEYSESLETRVEERTRELEAARQLLEHVVARAPMAIALLEPGGEVRLANSAFAALMDRKLPEEVTGVNLFELPELNGSQLVSIIRNGFATSLEEVQRFENVCLKLHEGPERTLTVLLAPFHINSGTGGNLMLMADDVSEHVRLESETLSYYRQLESAYKEIRETQSQLIQSAKMSAVGQLAGGVAHEFNNLLAGIQGYAEYAVSQSDAAVTHNCIATILKTTGRARDIVRNLLSFSRRSNYRTEQVSVIEILDETLQLVERQLEKQNVRIVRDYRDVPPVDISIGEIQQVFLNLVVNAAQAMPGGGDVTITTREEDGGIVIGVADRGEGIREEHLPHIFEPFFTTKGVFGDGANPGTGLGLCMCYRIIQNHKGRIDFETEIGKGTRFFVRLPVSGSGLKEPPVPGEKPHDALARKPANLYAGREEPILVVDDEEIIRRLMGDIISSLGLHAVMAASGEEAIAQVRENRFRIIFLDVMMPGMSGVQALRCIREIDPDAVPVMVTGRASDEAIEEANELGAYACVWKPFRINEITGLIQDILATPVASIDNS